MIQSKMASAVQAGFGISMTPPVYMTEGDTVTCGPSPRRPCDFDKNYVNIGDIPSSVAEKVISDCRHCRQSSPHLVEIKCLQWLNSIGNNR